MTYTYRAPWGETLVRCEPGEPVDRFYRDCACRPCVNKRAAATV